MSGENGSEVHESVAVPVRAGVGGGSELVHAGHDRREQPAVAAEPVGDALRGGSDAVPMHEFVEVGKGDDDRLVEFGIGEQRGEGRGNCLVAALRPVAVSATSRGAMTAKVRSQVLVVNKRRKVTQ